MRLVGTRSWSATGRAARYLLVVLASLLVHAGTAAAQPAHWSSVYIEPSTALAHVGELKAVSCPSARLCVAVDAGGNVFSSRDPSGGLSSWRLTAAMKSGLVDISCPSQRFCAAVDGYGDILTTSDPTAQSWKVADRNRFLVYAISCASSRLCVALDYGGNILSSRRPSAGRMRGDACTRQTPA